MAKLKQRSMFNISRLVRLLRLAILHSIEFHLAFECDVPFFFVAPYTLSKITAGRLLLALSVWDYFLQGWASGTTQGSAFSGSAPDRSRPGRFRVSRTNSRIFQISSASDFR